MNLRRNRILWTALVVAGAVCSASAIIDRDLDEMSDIWEAQYGLPTDDDGTSSPGQGPAGDLDGDGWTNLQESIAGTNPGLAQPPDGMLQTQITQNPLVPGVFVVSWPTLVGKKYTLMVSPDLSSGSWTQVGDPAIGDGSPIPMAIDLTGNTPIPDKLFWRVSVSDLDSDGDGLSDYEEGVIGTDSHNADTDGDKIWDGEEFLVGLPPLVANVSNAVGDSDDLPISGSLTQHFVVVGDEEEDVEHHEHKQFTIPASENGSLFLLAVHSDEFPTYTRNQDNPFDDTVEWSVTMSAGTGGSGSLNVNGIHSDWITDIKNEESLFEYAPVHYLLKKFIPPSATAITIDVDIKITNVSDGILPTTVIAAALPIAFWTHPITEGPEKGHDANLPYLPSYTAYFDDSWKKCTSIIWDAENKAWLMYHLLGEDDGATFFILEKQVSWAVDGVAQNSHDFVYGVEPPEDEQTGYFIEAKIKATGDTSDKMIFTVIRSNTKTKFENWYTAAAADMTWLATLPALYSSLYSGGGDPEPTGYSYWKSPGTTASLYHPGAAYEMRSESVAPTSSGHQACYDSSFNLITSGVMAGTADRYAPELGTLSDHRDNDVKPFIWALQLDGNCAQGTNVFRELTAPMIYQGKYLNQYLVVRPPIANTKPQLTPGSHP